MKVLKTLPFITFFLLLVSNSFAGQPAARSSDVTSFGGSIVEGSPTVMINGLPAARAGDQIVTPRFVFPNNCVGGPIVLGSATVFINNRGAVRSGDIATTVCGPEVIVGGSPTVQIGD
jgi:uncharacterized Zn-binding protein involved in type VI secretion